MHDGWSRNGIHYIALFACYVIYQQGFSENGKAVSYHPVPKCSLLSVAPIAYKDKKATKTHQREDSDSDNECLRRLWCRSATRLRWETADVVDRVLPYLDMVIWCTHATQAWRQSEAAVWSMVPKRLKSKSFLLLTRMDKIIDDRDKQRVISRVRKEVGGQFINSG